MTCPPDIASILLEIVRHGVLNARLAGWSGNAKLAAVEADHVHNLPELIADYSPDRLRYYWEVERTCYLNGRASESAASFDDAWKRLRPFIERLTVVAAAG